MSPPVLMTITEPCGEQITAARNTDLATTNGQKAFLVHELGVSRAEAARLIKAYAADVAAAVRIGNDTARSDTAFLSWLMRQAPGPGRQRSVLKHGWRVTSA